MAKLAQQVELENYRLRRENERLRERLQTAQLERELCLRWHSRLRQKTKLLAGLVERTPLRH